MTLDEATAYIRNSIITYGLRDWARAPYGAANHGWQPGVRSWKVMDTFKAFDFGSGAKNVHIVGEAYSDYQGFIEGRVEQRGAGAADDPGARGCGAGIRGLNERARPRGRALPPRRARRSVRLRVHVDAVLVVGCRPGWSGAPSRRCCCPTVAQQLPGAGLAVGVAVGHVPGDVGSLQKPTPFAVAARSSSASASRCRSRRPPTCRAACTGRRCPACRSRSPCRWAAGRCRTGRWPGPR